MRSEDKAGFTTELAEELPFLQNADSSLRMLMTVFDSELRSIKNYTLDAGVEHGMVIFLRRIDDELFALRMQGEQGSVDLTNYEVSHDEIPVMSVHTHRTSERPTDHERDIRGPAFPQDGDVLSHYNAVESLGPAYAVMSVSENKSPGLTAYTLGRPGAFTCAKSMTTAQSQERVDRYYRKLIQLYSASSLFA